MNIFRRNTDSKYLHWQFSDDLQTIMQKSRKMLFSHLFKCMTVGNCPLNFVMGHYRSCQESRVFYQPKRPVEHLWAMTSTFITSDSGNLIFSISFNAYCPEDISSPEGSSWGPNLTLGSLEETVESPRTWNVTDTLVEDPQTFSFRMSNTCFILLPLSRLKAFTNQKAYQSFWPYSVGFWFHTGPHATMDCSREPSSFPLLPVRDCYFHMKMQCPTIAIPHLFPCCLWYHSDPEIH